MQCLLVRAPLSYEETLKRRRAIADQAVIIDKLADRETIVLVILFVENDNKFDG